MKLTQEQMQEIREAVGMSFETGHLCYDSKEETIIIANEIIELIKDDNKRQALIRNLESAVTDYALEQNKCPTCGSDLVQLPTNKHADGFEHEFGTKIFSIWGCEFCDNMVK